MKRITGIFSNKKLTLRLADNAILRARGFIGTKDPDYGILFLFDEPDFHAFHGDGCNFDIVVYPLQQLSHRGFVVCDEYLLEKRGRVFSSYKTQFYLELPIFLHRKFPLRKGNCFRVES